MDITQFLEVLKDLGISVSSSAFIEFLKNYLSTRSSDHIQEFESQIQSFLDINGANVKASTVIEMLASHGLLSIRGSSIYAPEKITIGAGEAAQFRFGFDSKSSTDRTKVEAKGNAQIIGKNAAIVQNPDRSISFLVGKRDDEK